MASSCLPPARLIVRNLTSKNVKTITVCYFHYVFMFRLKIVSNKEENYKVSTNHVFLEQYFKINSYVKSNRTYFSDLPINPSFLNNVGIRYWETHLFPLHPSREKNVFHTITLKDNTIMSINAFLFNIHA